MAAFKPEAHAGSASAEHRGLPDSLFAVEDPRPEYGEKRDAATCTRVLSRDLAVCTQQASGI